ncbi:hypothetical protein J2S40_002542 [Nocardioides luteus]|uniref:DUF423 domain-containing protein n=1 Tax=Nocardioides luteus TaxID=1844 RepID=A0ABQ5T1K9_9ACTN|nr:hypothetical protein [Nocardioides luteus]MDR7311484.1 hypothetical protein [Nocardioides luteus]GGR55314.1 hypothetical protein GCM10010197_22380 [Nocardioides luteus]GLJ70134.1 hypothetical protein GCM10017579_41700 [Nocardioides luteus]
MSTTRRTGPSTAAMLLGMGLTVAAVVVVYVDRASADVLAGHIRAGYPGYDQGQIDTAATTYLAYLTVLGVLGVLAWGAGVWVTRKRLTVAPWLVSALFVVGTSVALFNLTVRDTSGATGLAPLIGWVGLLPSLAGLAAVVLVWRARRGEVAS